jgi:hypothetical protein
MAATGKEEGVESSSPDAATFGTEGSNDGAGRARSPTDDDLELKVQRCPFTYVGDEKEKQNLEKRIEISQSKKFAYIMFRKACEALPSSQNDNYLWYSCHNFD